MEKVFFVVVETLICQMCALEGGGGGGGNNSNAAFNCRDKKNYISLNRPNWAGSVLESSWPSVCLRHRVQFFLGL